MAKEHPDKWIRKAISDALSGLTVDGDPVPLFDSRTGTTTPEKYVLMQDISGQIVRRNKCSEYDRTTILISCVVRSGSFGNTGSRLAVDNIMNAVRSALEDLTLSPLSNRKIITQSESFPSDLVTPGAGEIIYQKFLRITLLIN